MILNVFNQELCFFMVRSIVKLMYRLGFQNFTLKQSYNKTNHLSIAKFRKSHNVLVISAVIHHLRDDLDLPRFRPRRLVACQTTTVRFSWQPFFGLGGKTVHALCQSKIHNDVNG